MISFLTGCWQVSSTLPEAHRLKVQLLARGGSGFWTWPQFSYHSSIAFSCRIWRRLEETDRWVGPLRSLLMKALANQDLGFERWEKISALGYDIDEACRELRQHLEELVTRHRSSPWRVVHADGALSAGARGNIPPPSEPVTGLLQAVASSRADLAPWIPYWSLQEHGGHLNWTCPLDNPSTQPSEQALANLSQKAHRSDLQTWLYPGTAGWGARFTPSHCDLVVQVGNPDKC